MKTILAMTVPMLKKNEFESQFGVILEALYILPDVAGPYILISHFLGEN